MKSFAVNILIIALCIFIQANGITKSQFRLKSQSKAWPRRLIEVTTNKTKIIEGKCASKENCRNWNEIKDTAYCKVSDKLHKLNSNQAFYYVETRKKTEVEGDIAQLLFTQITEDKESSGALNRTAKFFSVCVPVNSKDPAFTETVCPLDECGKDKKKNENECSYVIQSDKITVFLKGKGGKNAQSSPPKGEEKKETEKVVASVEKPAAKKSRKKVFRFAETETSINLGSEYLDTANAIKLYPSICRQY